MTTTTAGNTATAGTTVAGGKANGEQPDQPSSSGASRKLAAPTPLIRLFPRLRPYVGKLSIAAVCLVGAAAAALAFPAVVRHLLDAAFQARDRALLDRIALFLLGIFALQGVFNFVQVYLLTSTAERVIARLREDLFAHLVRLSPGFFTELRTGELTSRMSSDLAVLQSTFSTWISEFSRQSLLLVGGIIMLSLTHRSLTLTTLAVVPVVVGAAILFGRRLRRATTGVQDRIAEAMGTADEALSQIRTVQSFTREDAEVTRFRGLYRVGFYTPVITSIVAVAVVWRFLLQPDSGLVNTVLGFVGIDGPNWLGDTRTSLLSLIIMATWRNFGTGMIIFLAGLQSVPWNLHEAAMLDGASSWQRFWNITLPLLRPTLLFVMVTTTIGYLQFFEEPFVMTQGGPLNSTISASMYTYNQFGFGNYGVAGAMAYLTFLVIVVVTLIQFRITREK